MRDLAGHAPDHAGRFVLGQHVAAGGDDRLGALQAVRAHAGEHQRQRLGPQTSAAEANSGSTAGLQKLTRGPSSSAIVGGPSLARDAHVLAAGRDVDAAGLDRLAVDAPRAPAASRAGRDARPEWR